jgi:hypothetical protein
MQLRIPTEIHVEILFWLVARCFNELVDNHKVLQPFEDLINRFEIFLGHMPEEEEDADKYHWQAAPSSRNATHRAGWLPRTLCSGIFRKHR